MITTQKSQAHGVWCNYIFELNMMYPAYRRASQPAGWQGCTILRYTMYDFVYDVLCQCLNLIEH